MEGNRSEWEKRRNNALGGRQENKFENCISLG